MYKTGSCQLFIQILFVLTASKVKFLLYYTQVISTFISPVTCFNFNLISYVWICGTLLCIKIHENWGFSYYIKHFEFISCHVHINAYWTQFKFKCWFNWFYVCNLSSNNVCFIYILLWCWDTSDVSAHFIYFCLYLLLVICMNIKFNCNKL